MNEKETKWRNVSELKVGEQFRLRTGEVLKVEKNKHNDCRECFFDIHYDCPWKAVINENGVLWNMLACNENGRFTRRYVRIK